MLSQPLIYLLVAQASSFLIPLTQSVRLLMVTYPSPCSNCAAHIPNLIATNFWYILALYLRICSENFDKKYRSAAKPISNHKFRINCSLKTYISEHQFRIWIGKKNCVEIVPLKDTFSEHKFKIWIGEKICA